MSNGSPFTYTKWFVGEPNGGTKENCLSVNTRGGQGYAWNDAPCTEEHHFICEYYEYYPTSVEEHHLKTRMFVWAYLKHKSCIYYIKPLFAPSIYQTTLINNL